MATPTTLLPDFLLYPADWALYGAGAGPRRNARMVSDGDALIAFPGGRGTANVTRQCSSPTSLLPDLPRVKGDTSLPIGLTGHRAGGLLSMATTKVSVRKSWDTYLKNAIPNGTSDSLVEWALLAFYAGAAATFYNLIGTLGNKETSAEENISQMRAMAKELEDFKDSVVAYRLDIIRKQK